MNDTLFKADAAWKFGDFHVKLALGAWVPDGTQQQNDGLGNVGLPFFTIQPEFVLSWEPQNWLWGGNWNFTAYTYWELSTENRVTGYQNAPIFHVDFTATGTWGKWTIGPVAWSEGSRGSMRSRDIIQVLICNSAAPREANSPSAQTMVGSSFICVPIGVQETRASVNETAAR